MTTPYQTHRAPVAQDPVVAALGGLGSPVDCTGLRSLSLEGPLVLWLVVEGRLDLFAVDAAQDGHWHFLGRLEAGTLLLGPPDGPRHTLVGRPLHGCLLRRIELRELYRPEYADPWAGQAYDAPLSPLEGAFALGIGRGLRVLYQAPLENRATAGPAAGADEDVLWMQITPGSVHYGAAYEGHEGHGTAGTLLVDGAMWQGMVDQQYRLLHALDHWIEQVERAHEDRAAAGIEAGEAARVRADQALLASIDRSGGRTRTGADDDATFAACHLVARDAGIALTEPTAGGSASGQTDPVERVALASRVRTRAVRLQGRWWRENSGPLVGRHAEDDT
ncbi:NHLP bacteriocin export ABC transporter permease/ATPase subunit, partial [Streptomyces sp. NPDC049577]